MLRRSVGLDQTHVEIEIALCDRRAKIDGQRQWIAGSLRMINQRPQDRRRRGAAERADKRPVVIAGPSLPAAVAGGDPCGLVEQMWRPGMHESSRNDDAVSFVIACDKRRAFAQGSVADEAIQSVQPFLDCFASLAMTFLFSALWLQLPQTQ
jgi:hypothetical protein